MTFSRARWPRRSSVSRRLLGWVDIHADDEDVPRGERHGLASLDGETGCTTFYASPFATDVYRWRRAELMSELGLLARHVGRRHLRRAASVRRQGPITEALGPVSGTAWVHEVEKERRDTLSTRPPEGRHRVRPRGLARTPRRERQIDTGSICLRRRIFPV